MFDIEKKNFIISINKLRVYNYKINMKNLEEARRKKIVAYNEEVKIIIKDAENKYKNAIEKKNTEINELKQKLKLCKEE